MLDPGGASGPFVPASSGPASDVGERRRSRTSERSGSPADGHLSPRSAGGYTPVANRPGAKRACLTPPSNSPASLEPYLPRLLTTWLAEAPGTTLRAVDGHFVFVDISGFTKMSERLARDGKVGAEEVTDVIEAVFASLLTLAYDVGGGLVEFGGDTLLLSSPGKVTSGGARTPP